MQIEVYTIEAPANSEASELAADGQSAIICEKLGLVGQQKLLAPDSSRLAWPHITRLQSLVFQTLFPEKNEVEKFDTEIIPVRVLEVLEQAKDSGLFVAFSVWHSPTRKDDPILVAHTGEKNPQTWNPNYYNTTGTFLLARWGEALADFKLLCAEAKEQWTAEKRRALKKDIREKQGELEDLEDTAEVMFKKGVL
jgi:hypothetical protein